MSRYLQVRVEDEEWRGFRKLCIERGVTVQVMMEEMVRKFLKEEIRDASDECVNGIREGEGDGRS